MDNKINEKIISMLAEIAGAENVTADCCMKDCTSFRCGGNAAVLVDCESTDVLRACLALAEKEDIPYIFLGNGSNTLFSDGGYDGMVLRLSRKGEFAEIRVDGCRIAAGAAVLLSELSSAACAAGLSGLEFASGIPGSVGGAVFMNAGAYGGEMSLVVKKVICAGAEYDASQLDFSYRHSRFTDAFEPVLFAVFELERGDKQEIKKRMAELAQKRSEKQPLAYPSAGSFFKRPEGHFAGALIEQAGLKGLKLGGAQISEQHAGFMINAGGASASDVIDLMKVVQETVYAQTGIMLEPEVRIVGISA